MITIEGNKILVGFPQNENMAYPKPYLVLKDNPRPKCALIIGDGFTQGYLSHYDLKNEIPCTINDLIPSSRQIPYIPTEGDVFSDGNFFTKEKWPKIFKKYSEGLQGSEFFKEISKNKVNPKYSDGLWSLDNNTIGYELRCYLWHLFRSIHYKFDQVRSFKKISSEYDWYLILKTVLENYSLQIINFSYDMLVFQALEDTFNLYPSGRIKKERLGELKYPVEMSYDYYMNFYGVNDIPICHVHGTWASRVCVPFPNFVNGQLESKEEFTPNPWLEGQLKFRNNYFTSASSRFDIDRNSFPIFPDIVPPGFQGHDKCNPFSKVLETSRKIAKESDLMIICGLSGNEPDTEEVSLMLKSIDKDIDVLHVGLDQDKESPVARILKGMENINWLFFNAQNELAKTNDYLLDTLNG